MVTSNIFNNKILAVQTMPLRFFVILFYLSFISILFSCKKEYLEPSLPPSNNSNPVIFISAILDSDSVYYAGGVDSYEARPSIFDTLTYRRFDFTLSSSQHPAQLYFKISMNNYDTLLGPPQSDLDSSMYSGLRNYQLNNGPIWFTPLQMAIEWFDASGQRYTSRGYLQSTAILITSVEEVYFQYKKYKKVSLEFECYLKSTSITNPIHLTNGTAVVLFSAE